MDGQAVATERRATSLTQEQIDFFRANGYLKWGPLIEPDEIALLREQYDHEFSVAEEGSSSMFRNLAVFDSEKDKGKPARRMLQIVQMSDRNMHYRRLIHDPRILDIVQDLIGPNIMLFHDQALYKPAFDGGAVFWHQDNAYWKCVPANLVSCWITLDDVDDANGAMNVLPGSHLRPAHHEVSTATDRLLETIVDERDAVVVDLPAGGCMFHHCQTLHTTKPNDTDRQRRAFAIHFMTPGTRSKDGEILKVGFSRPMLRMAI